MPEIKVINLDGETFVNVEQLMDAVCEQFGDPHYSGLYKEVYGGYDETAGDIVNMLRSLFGDEVGNKFATKWAKARYAWAFKDES